MTRIEHYLDQQLIDFCRWLAYRLRRYYLYREARAALGGLSGPLPECKEDFQADTEFLDYLDRVAQEVVENYLKKHPD